MIVRGNGGKSLLFLSSKPQVGWKIQRRSQNLIVMFSASFPNNCIVFPYLNVNYIVVEYAGMTGGSS